MPSKTLTGLLLGLEPLQQEPTPHFEQPEINKTNINQTKYIPPQHIMIKTSLFSLLTVLGIASVAQASFVTLTSTGRSGPIALDSGLVAVDTGLVRLGTVSAAPASGSFDDIAAVFAEYGTGETGTGAQAGFFGQTINNAGGTSDFDNDQIYIWIFDGDTANASTENGLFSLVDADAPAVPWRFPVQTGTGTDGVSIVLADLFDGNGAASDGSQIDSQTVGGRVILAPIPEPSGAMLAALGGVFLVFRRRRS